MSDVPQVRRYPEMGALSANGSRRWDGQFWVPLHTDPPLDELRPPVVRPYMTELPFERRGFRPGGVLLAAVVGVVLSNIHVGLPGTGSLDSLAGMIAANLLLALSAFGGVIVILSIGRQGADVLLLRAMVVAFIQGAVGAILLGAPPFPIPLGIPWALVVFAVGLFWAVVMGLFYAAMAILANLLWYRSFRSLRPQLRIFNGASRASQNPPS